MISARSRVDAINFIFSTLFRLNVFQPRDNILYIELGRHSAHLLPRGRRRRSLHLCIIIVLSWRIVQAAMDLNGLALGSLHNSMA